MRNSLMMCAASLCLALAACATPISVSTDSSLQSFKPIQSSPKDTCETQKQVAAHNSVHDTLKSGKQVVYSAQCESGPATAKAAPAEKAPA